MLRIGDLLERHRVGPGGAWHRRPREQHAWRGGPEPARLPPAGRRVTPAFDDVADDHPARRRARGRPRERRLEPHPLGDRPGDPAPDRRRHGRGCGGPGSPRPFRRCGRQRRAGDRLGSARAHRRCRHRGRPLGRAEHVLRRRSGRHPRSGNGRAERCGRPPARRRCRLRLVLRRCQALGLVETKDPARSRCLAPDNPRRR